MLLNEKEWYLDTNTIWNYGHSIRINSRIEYDSCLYKSPKTIFSGDGIGIAWNGTIFVAVGLGSSNSIAISYDGIIWTRIINSLFT